MLPILPNAKNHAENLTILKIVLLIILHIPVGKTLSVMNDN